jgi:drug/metabolite transporter (DMT)-like permease
MTATPSPLAAESPEPLADPISNVPARHRPPVAGYLLAAAGATLFSTKAIIIKLAYAEGLNAETLLALRMGLSLPIYLAIGLMALRQRIRQRLALPASGLVLRAAIIGALGYWFASYADFVGLLYISAHFERLILFTYPGFVVLFGAMFFRHRVRMVTLAAFGVSYAGLAVIFASGHNPATSRDTALGAAWVLAAAMAFAAYQLLAKPAIERVGSRLFTCIAMTGAASVALVQFFATQPTGNLLVNPAAFWYALLLAIGATVLPSFMLNAALHRISAQANAIIGTLSPVVTIVLAVLILGEHLGPADVVGAVLVLAGVGWFTLADRRR